MNIRALIRLSLLFLVLPLFARENTDVIVMKNGDHLTGQVKALDGGVLYVSLPYVIQTISIDWSDVVRLESKQLFLVKTADGAVYRGILNSTEAPAGRPIQIQVAETPEKNVVLDSEQIVNVSVTSEKFFRRFTGGLSVVRAKLHVWQQPTDYTYDDPIKNQSITSLRSDELTPKKFTPARLKVG